MPEQKVYRFRIDPTTRQEAALSRYAGARRFVFNWTLARRKETYEQTGKSISWSGLSAELTGLKSKPGFEWLKEIDSQLLQQALADCKRAFDNFFQKRAGFPKFKKKHSAQQSFRIPQRVKLEDGRVYVPKIGWVAIRQSQVVDLPLKRATFKREATGKWHVSLAVEFDLPDLHKPAIETETAIGIDIGFDRFATDSDGGVVENPRFFRKAERKIKRASRRLSGCKKGSANRAKARRALAREYEKLPLDRFFPSSKLCSSCGHLLDELPLFVREWDCPGCGAHHDRDVNAAINIKKAGQYLLKWLKATGSGARKVTPTRDERRRSA